MSPIPQQRGMPPLSKWGLSRPIKQTMEKLRAIRDAIEDVLEDADVPFAFDNPRFDSILICTPDEEHFDLMREKLEPLGITSVEFLHPNDWDDVPLGAQGSRLLKRLDGYMRFGPGRFLRP